MSAIDNNVFLGQMVPAKWVPNLFYPHFKQWYKTQTYMSGAVTHLEPYISLSGTHRSSMIPARRDWHGTTAPARTSVYATNEIGIDITTPAYMLAGTTTTDATQGDTVVGLDYGNVPLQMHKDINALSQVRQTIFDSTLEKVLYARVNAIKHTFTFQNYGRQPVEIYYTILPTGYPFVDISQSTAPGLDQEQSQYRRITILGVLDSGDKAQRRSVNVGINLAKIFPQSYDLGPQQHNDNITTGNYSSSPWMALQQASP